VSFGKADLVEVKEFTRQREGEEVVIGLPVTNSFLALPLEALEILDCLSSGKTVGEAQLEFVRAHGVEPDVDDLLQCLERRGFVRLLEGPELKAKSADYAGARTRYHFSRIPVSVAKRFFGPFALFIYSATIFTALVIAISHPSLIPGRSSLLFTRHRTLKICCLALIGYGTVFLHEFAHLLAAKARGVESRVGISNRLWILVAETDMTGLWAVPRNRRYLPVLAGPLLDSFCAALLFLVYVGDARNLFLPVSMGQLVRALIFMYIFRLLWQCCLFVRTDFYYVITTFFGCKNLMKDTQIFLRNLLLRAVGSEELIDQGHIPRRERNVIKLYSILWVLGRGVALASLFFVTLPIMLHYVGGAFLALRRGYVGDHYGYIDSVMVGLINIAPIAIGLILWATSHMRRGGRLERS
jgi:putative peptide zinc metalloprotease protein